MIEIGYPKRIFRFSSCFSVVKTTLTWIHDVSYTLTTSLFQPVQKLPTWGVCNSEQSVQLDLNLVTHCAV